MAGSERRKSPRTPLKFEINYLQEGDFLISYSRDISADGMFINTENPLSVKERVTLTFSLEGSDPFNVDARVMWTNREGEKKDKGMGVKFIQPTKRLQSAILSIVNKVAVTGS